MWLKLSLSLCAVAACFGPAWSRDVKTEQGPKDLYAAIGSSAELPCANGTRKGSKWRLNGLPLVTSPVLYLHNTSLEDQGVYTCHGPNGDVVEALNLQLGHAPTPPDVRCWSPSYPLRATCTWTLTPDPLLPTQYISTYRYHGAVHQCPRTGEQDRRCVLEGLELYSNEPYLVNITAVNALGSASHVLAIFFEDIVKPDPPVNVTVTALPGKKVSVQWAPPPAWPDETNFPLRYSVEFQWGDRNQTSLMGPYESGSMVRSGIVAGRTYRIRVSCADFLGHGRRSEWSDTVSVTLPKS